MLWFLYFDGVRVPRRFCLLCCGSCILVRLVFLVVLVCCVVVLVFDGVRVPRRFSFLCCGSCILVRFVFLIVLVRCVVVLVF